MNCLPVTAMCLLTAQLCHAKDSEEPVFLDIITVVGLRDNQEYKDTIYTVTAPSASPDAATLLNRTPGAAVVSNGSLSGQIQYRGVFGARVPTKINFQSFHSGGPNLMDPPMHYAPSPLIDRIEVNRGIGPVDFGPSFTGGVNAILKSVDYQSTSEFKTSMDLNAAGRSADKSHAYGGSLGLSNDRLRIFTLFSREKGSDADYPDGKISNTFYERAVYGLSAGIRTETSEMGFEFRHHDTRPTGNAPFAMDIEFVQTDFLNLTASAKIGQLNVTSQLGYTEVSHGMNNFEFRPNLPDRSKRRKVMAGSHTYSGSIRGELKKNLDRTIFGIDRESAFFDVTLSNPEDANFFIDNLPAISTSRTGVFIDWGRSYPTYGFSIGSRIDVYKTEAGIAEIGTSVPLPVKNLANQFNQSDRQWDETTMDGIARFWRYQKFGTIRLSLGYKNRAPSHLERYAWLPTAASAGLADGNNYLGDLELSPENNLVIELGMDLDFESWWWRPVVYYHHVNNYIQGTQVDLTPNITDSLTEMVSAANGDSTPLRFTNVPARMYGFDSDFGIRLSNRLSLEGVFSMVRGKRRDIRDNLYRMSPDRLSLVLLYEYRNLMASLEGVFNRKQNKVSITNHEEKTAGYATANLLIQWMPAQSFLVSLGLENIFNREYRSHLSGYNRVMGSDVTLGDRIPGRGRSLYFEVRFWH